MDSPGRSGIPKILIGLAFLSGLAVIIVIVVIALNPRQQGPTTIIFVTPTSATRVAARRPTDVPTVTLVPPTPTPTDTPLPPTITPTPTPITPTASPLPPTLTPIPPTATRRPPPVASVKRCVSVAGDSVAHGDAVFEIPGVGYLQAQMAPVSAFIDYQYRNRGVANVQVFNRSSSAVGISSGRHPSYFGSFEYAALLQDACQYTVIIPWINDLSSGVDTSAAAPAHVGALARLAQAVIAKNSTGKVLIVNYYQGAASQFALSSFAFGFTPGNVAAFNGQIGAACSGGPLALPQVRCVDANAALGGMGLSHVVGPITKPELDSLLIAPPNPDQGNQVSFYFTSNPSGTLVGDGVHLSNAGKARLAAYLVDQMP